jgi:predicted N-acetyltransferase YhbS
MGKIFPLSEKTSCFNSTVALIERSFGYKGPNSFQTDFAPLMDESNHHNCFILVDEDEKVIAHIGVKEKKITLGNKTFPVLMLGGIAVDESKRGKGIFQELFIHVLTLKREEASMLFLWSDLEKLYNKFGFYLCGSQFEVARELKPSTFTRKKLQELTVSEMNELKALHKNSFTKIYATLKRTDEDWELLKKITSADLYIRKENDHIRDYYFINKGQDLIEIIYEYGTTGNIEELLETIGHFGKIWMGKEIIPSHQTQYQFFMSPGDGSLFKEFIKALTEDKVSIQSINSMKQEVYFDYNNETLGLSIDEFLRGLFGPETFEELDLPSLFISGLESI